MTWRLFLVLQFLHDTYSQDLISLVSYPGCLLVWFSRLNIATEVNSLLISETSFWPKSLFVCFSVSLSVWQTNNTENMWCLLFRRSNLNNKESQQILQFAISCWLICHILLIYQCYPSSIEALLANRLLPLDKGEGAVRPIGVGEVLRRIIGKCVVGVT